MVWAAVLLCLPCGKQLHAQDKPIKWGEVPRADLEMPSFQADSNATAVILCDVAEVSFDSEFQLNFERHRRIKILSPAGFKWGGLALSYYDEDRIQRVDRIDGYTHILEANGKVRHEKLDKKSIFDEDVDGKRRRVRFTLPALAPGAVVEYRYRIHSKYATFLHDWEFQSEEPTRWSELRVEVPSVLNYVIVRQEVSKFDLYESKELPWPSTLSYGQTAEQYNLKIMSHRWVVKDMPALREEPFMTTVDDFCAKIEFQLSSYRWPGELEEKVMHTWEKLAEDLMESENFGRQIEGHKVLREQAQTLVAGVTDPETKMRRIYDYVRTTMNWDEERGIYTEVSLDKAWRARRGGGPEIALMLTGMLRAAGLEAHPVLVSTRDHGRVYDIYSMLTQFNHVLTYVKAGTKDHLLDATDPFRPYNMLPVAALNQTGWMVRKKNPVWVNIVNPGSYHNETLVSAELSADGKISGNFYSRDEGYSGLFDRRRLRDGKKDEDYIRDGWLEDLAGAQLDSFTINNRDSADAPLLTQGYFSTSDHAQVAGDNIYFNPMFFGRTESNPLKNPQRTFPVDYAYARTLLYTANLKLPEGYTVQELPGNLALALPGDAAQFRRVMDIQGNILQMISQTVIRKVRFQPGEYKALREFYDRIVAAHADQIVLKRAVAGQAREGMK
jgi:hypothetical protein